MIRVNLNLYPKPWLERSGSNFPSTGYTLMRDGSEIPFDMKNDPEAVKKLDMEEAVAMVLYCPKPNTYSARWVRLDETNASASGETRAEVNRKAIQKQRDEEEYKAKFDSDPEFAYEEMLKRADWYYSYSDDHRIWAAGERYFDKMNELGFKLPEFTRNELYNKYCPYAKEA